ncbi:MAG: hypothetical protein C4558_03200 [Dehalococcoidia bacterium]|nr:MAG: hypothetical protein C4558_03200 [Dehalococcoidia bacterium]
MAWSRRWGLGFAALGFATLGLLLGACFDGPSLDIDVPDTASAPSSPIVLVSTTSDVTGDPTAGPAVGPAVGAWVPAGSLPPRDASPTPAPTPERGAEAVIQPDVIVTLRLSERVRVSDTGWTVGFREVVEDSRCPTDVRCVWAGQVSVRLLGEHADGRVAALTLTMPAGGPASGVLGDLRVDARGIEPVRRVEAPAPASYTLSLRVSVSPSPGSTVLSGVRGRVTIGPMCPVMRVDQPCPDQPYRALLIVHDTSGREITRIESSEDGTYALVLPPGSYMMSPQSPSASRLPWASPQPFEVRPSVWTVMNIEFDSGIR